MNLTPATAPQRPSPGDLADVAAELTANVGLWYELDLGSDASESAYNEVRQHLGRGLEAHRMASGTLRLRRLPE